MVAGWSEKRLSRKCSKSCCLRKKLIFETQFLLHSTCCRLIGFRQLQGLDPARSTRMLPRYPHLVVFELDFPLVSAHPIGFGERKI